MTVGDLIREVNALELAEVPGLSTLIIAAAARMAEAKSAPAPAERAAPEPDDVNLSIEEAAALLRRSTKWIYRHRARLPFVRKLGPRSYVCSKSALDRWLVRQHA